MNFSSKPGMLRSIKKTEYSHGKFVKLFSRKVLITPMSPSFWEDYTRGTASMIPQEPFSIKYS